MATVGDIITGTGSTIGLQAILNNRQDVLPSSTIYQALVVAAIREISESYPFDELRETGPNFTLTTGTFSYPLTSWLNSPDVNPTQVLSFALLLPAGTSGSGASSAVIMLDYKNPKELEPMTQVPGPPKNWTRFGTNIIIGPQPDQNYVTYMRYQNEHPFVQPFNAQTVQLPNSWLEIVAYTAAIRAAINLRAESVAQSCHSILYGDPEFQTSQGKQGRPGIIAARLFNQERDAKFNAGTMIPMIPSYSYGGY